jgi:hypothetical protein
MYKHSENVFGEAEKLELLSSEEPVPLFSRKKRHPKL